MKIGYEMLQNIIHGYIIWNYSVVYYVLGSNTSRCLGNEPALLPPNRGGPGEGRKSSFGNMYALDGGTTPLIIA